jgi:hypothetical protein
MEELLEDSFRCDGFDNTPFTGKLLLKVKHTEHLHTVTREGGQLFQCSQAAHFLDDEGLEVYLQNWNEGRGSDTEGSDTLLFSHRSVFVVIPRKNVICSLVIKKWHVPHYLEWAARTRSRSSFRFHRWTAH